MKRAVVWIGIWTFIRLAMFYVSLTPAAYGPLVTRVFDLPKQLEISQLASSESNLYIFAWEGDLYEWQPGIGDPVLLYSFETWGNICYWDGSLILTTEKVFELDLSDPSGQPVLLQDFNDMDNCKVLTDGRLALWDQHVLHIMSRSEGVETLDLPVSIEDLDVTNDGKVWAASQNTILKYSQNDWSEEFRVPDLMNITGSLIHVTRDDGLLFGLAGKVYWSPSSEVFESRVLATVTNVKLVDNPEGDLILVVNSGREIYKFVHGKLWKVGELWKNPYPFQSLIYQRENWLVFLDNFGIGLDLMAVDLEDLDFLACGFHWERVNPASLCYGRPSPIRLPWLVED